MRKMKLLTAILFCLGIAGMASAVEVINIDLNAQGNDIAHSGYAPTDVGTNIWQAYSEGWGKPMGSPRSNHLADYNEPNKPGVYAAQVWIGDDANVAHGYQSGSGTGLMDDGFVKTGGSEDPDPKVRLWGINAYGGTGGLNDPNFDIYVLSAEDGNFTLTSLRRNETKHVDGGEDNYAVFEDVNIADDANAVTISYDNVLNGLQLVKRKYPLAIEIDDANETFIPATAYDVAYETNTRTGPGSQRFGPDIDGVNDVVMYIDVGEYMEYDITVDEANEGEYEITAFVDTGTGYPCTGLEVYIDDIYMGTLSYELASLGEFVETATTVVGDDRANLFEGSHTFKWLQTTSDYGYNLQKFEFKQIKPSIVMDDCDEVYKYRLNYTADYTGDCHVDFNDLAVITDDWLNCYSPDPNDCL